MVFTPQDIDELQRAGRRMVARRRIQNEIDHQRWSQIDQWGFDDHHERSQEFMDLIIHRSLEARDEFYSDGDLVTLRHRYVQLAAVALAAIEKMDEAQGRCYESSDGQH